MQDAEFNAPIPEMRRAPMAAVSATGQERSFPTPPKSDILQAMNAPDPDLLPKDLEQALNNFTLAEETAFRPYLVALEAEEPPPLFHYTDEAGLRGILATGSFRLTDAFQLNDPNELIHGLNLLDDELAAATGGGGRGDCCLPPPD